MEGFDPLAAFGPEVAEHYDERCVRGDEGATVGLLAELAGPGPLLELAVGTGRIALPLAATGLPVDGIEASPAMVERLRAKPGGDRVAVTVGDFAEVPVPGRYRLVYLVFNTLHNLLTQDAQVRCFERVADHLEEGGRFVVETGVPARHHREGRQYVHAEAVELGSVRLDVARHDPVRQVLEESHVTLSAEGGVQVEPIVTRYAWPSELDLMARIAGLRLEARWGGWGREPFTADSDNAVSVYVR